MNSKLWRRYITGYAVLIATLPLGAQQKGQYVLGQYGLNAGILPDPGVTYANITLNYPTNTFNDSSGNAVARKPSLNLWIVENMFYYVPDNKILGGNLGFMVAAPTVANGSLTLEQVNRSGSAFGLTDIWLQPLTLGWHLKRVDLQVGDAIVYPTGRYAPGALSNIGGGYYGNHVFTGTTLYLTKDKGTSANLFTDWEAHGEKAVTNGAHITPGQAFSDEWGLGQILPLSKDFSKLAQFGVIGYDQWQVTANGGNYAISGPFGNIVFLPASLVPFYSVHAIGGQVGFVMPGKGLNFFFKYEHEYLAKATTIGNTLVFGGSWTFKIPRTP